MIKIRKTRVAVLTVLLIGIICAYGVYAQSLGSSVNANTPEVSYCCEKTLTGGYCINSPKEKCDMNFGYSPTSCEATSYCKRGCCYDSNEGMCMENTPEEACKIADGAWQEGSCSNSAECALGCCVMGQQAAFTTLIRCKKLTAFYGIKTDFRQGVADELTCIGLAGAEQIGACVYESEFQKTCKFTTRAQCETALQTAGNTSIGFHEGRLCTDLTLGTICQPSSKTMCVDGKEGVYFTDSCGNPANIYDANMVYEGNKGDASVREYWTKVKTKDESCKAGNGGANSKTCGNCEYLGGGLCASSKSAGTKPKYGDYICRDINCHDTSNGKDYKNGESWCYWDDKTPLSQNVGSVGFRHICMMGEEIVEMCDVFRNTICMESPIAYSGGSFSQAGCGVNRWQDCVLINTSADCANTDKRDCKWISLDTPEDAVKSKIEYARYGIESELGRCVPKVSPGLQFWDESAKETCKYGTQKCIVKFEKKVLGGEKTCVENCDCCVDEKGCDATAAEAKKALANKICSSYGDCGSKFNYIGKYVDKGYKITITKDGNATGQVESGQGGGSAAPSTSSTSGTSSSSTPFSEPNPPSGGTEFTSGAGADAISTQSGAAQPTGSVIQGLIVKAYNKIGGGK
jgi:hypothetical protein